MRKAFINCVRAEVQRDKDMAVFLGDISVAGFLQPNDELVERVYNCGILEQAMVSFAAGCAAGGLYPVVQTIIPFLVERAFEQIKLDFCAQGNRGLLVGVGGGLEYSKLGYTHHTLWDTSLLANLEGLLLFTPTVGAAEVTEVLPELIRSRTLAYARLTESYLGRDALSSFGVGQLSAIRVGRSQEKARVLCGSYPGMQTHLAVNDIDLYAYSFPNLLPRNLGELSKYREIEVWEFGTAPLLTFRLREALRTATIIGHCQEARFFRAYGNQAAADFVASNWRQIP